MEKGINTTCKADRNEMLEKIMQYRFAALETALYLDTHPNDPNVLNRHNEFSLALENLIAEYNESFNDPLSSYDRAQGRWTYIDNWPVGLDCFGVGYETNKGGKR